MSPMPTAAALRRILGGSPPSIIKAKQDIAAIANRGGPSRCSRFARRTDRLDSTVLYRRITIVAQLTFPHQYLRSMTKAIWKVLNTPIIENLTLPSSAFTPLKATSLFRYRCLSWVAMDTLQHGAVCWKTIALIQHGNKVHKLRRDLLHATVVEFILIADCGAVNVLFLCTIVVIDILSFHDSRKIRSNLERELPIVR